MGCRTPSVATSSDAARIFFAPARKRHLIFLSPSCLTSRPCMSRRRTPPRPSRLKSASSHHIAGQTYSERFRVQSHFALKGQLVRVAGSASQPFKGWSKGLAPLTHAGHALSAQRLQTMHGLFMLGRTLQAACICCTSRGPSRNPNADIQETDAAHNRAAPADATLGGRIGPACPRSPPEGKSALGRPTAYRSWLPARPPPRLQRCGGHPRTPYPRLRNLPLVTNMAGLLPMPPPCPCRYIRRPLGLRTSGC